MEEIYKDLSKRLSQCALQRDFTTLSTQLDRKANRDDIEEALASKANK